MCICVCMWLNKSVVHAVFFFFFWKEGIDLSVFHRKVLKVQSVLMALTLCSP